MRQRNQELGGGNQQEDNKKEIKEFLDVCKKAGMPTEAGISSHRMNYSFQVPRGQKAKMKKPGFNREKAIIQEN